MSRAALHLRQETWLDTAPKEWPVNRYTTLVRRLGEAEARRWIVPPGPLKWLIDLTMDAGGAIAEGGMAPGWRGLNWTEIRDWMDVTQQRLQPGTARKLRTLSRVYASALQAAQEPDSPAPWEPPKAGA